MSKDRIWVPDITLINLDEMKNYGIESFRKADVQSDGTGKIKHTRYTSKSI